MDELKWTLSFEKKIGELVPAKAIPSKQIAYIPFEGDEIPKYDYHVSERSKETFKVNAFNCNNSCA